MVATGVALASGSRVFSSTHWLGLPIALLGAIFLSLGTIYQNRGVEAGGERETQFKELVRRPAWLVGTGLLGAAVLLQLGALRFSPLMVIQPIGVSALVATAVIKAVRSHESPGKRTVLAIALCIAGLVGFVAVAAIFAQDVQVDDERLRNILILLGCVIAGAVLVWVRNRRRASAAASTVGARVLYGFVATLAKAVIGRVVQGDFEWLSLVGLAGLGLALALGLKLVQKAHANGSEELVVAGLTVVDPMVAVILGIAVFGEAGNAPPIAFAGFLTAGAAAVAGVWLMSRHQDETKTASR